jgi:tetratricopeptide (TPR) repeat protein
VSDEQGTTEAGVPRKENDEHPLTRPVTVAIVLVSLAIAAVGYLQIQASQKSNDAGQQAQRLSTLTMSKLLTNQSASQVQYELFLQSQDQLGRAGNALQQSQFVAGEAKVAYQTEQQLWQTLARRTQALTPLSPTSPEGPQNDPNFPRAFFSKSTQAALEQQALKDAANATNSAWESSAARYTAILTLFAVSLFLLGFALALPDQVLRIFAYVGGGLLLLGVVWAVIVALDAPKEISPESAKEYAIGEVALESAVDPAGADVAIEHFTKAIDAWPDFSRAYLGRANATLFGSASQVEATLIPPETLERVRSDLEIAQSNGFDNALLLEQLGGTAFSLGLHDREDEFQTAIDTARTAIEDVPDDPVPRFTLAASLLAQGQIPEAEGAYGEALHSVLYLHAGADEPRNAPAFEQVWISGALSDLEAVGVAKPDLADEVTKLKEFLVGSFAARGVATPGGDATFNGVQVQLTPTSLFWLTESNTGYDAASQRLSAEWYFREHGSAWVGMPEVSGVIDPSTEPGAPGFSGRNLVGQSIPPRCVGSADYRVELYVDGHLAGSAEATADFGPMTPYIDRAVNLQVCAPSDWELTDTTLPGFRAGLQNSDGSQGVYLFRYNLTTLPADERAKPAATIADDLLQQSVRDNVALFPAPPSAQGDAAHQNFQGLDGSTERVFVYPGGGAVQGLAGIDQQDQAVFVAFVFGPAAEFQSPDAAKGGLVSVVQSISEYRPGGGSF